MSWAKPGKQRTTVSSQKNQTFAHLRFMDVWCCRCCIAMSFFVNLCACPVTTLKWSLRRASEIRMWTGDLRSLTCCQIACLQKMKQRRQLVAFAENDNCLVRKSQMCCRTHSRSGKNLSLCCWAEMSFLRDGNSCPFSQLEMSNVWASGIQNFNISFTNPRPWFFHFFFVQKKKNDTIECCWPQNNTTFFQNAKTTVKNETYVIHDNPNSMSYPSDNQSSKLSQHLLRFFPPKLCAAHIFSHLTLFRLLNASQSPCQWESECHTLVMIPRHSQQ